MSRKIRTTQKNFKVFCEGDTEYNYIDEMRRQKRLSISLKPVNMNVTQYIIKELKYRSVDDLKADGKIYNILNTKECSYALMLSSLKKENCFIINHYAINKKLYEIKISTIFDWEKLGRKGSNINEFFEVLNSFNT